MVDSGSSTNRGVKRSFSRISRDSEQRISPNDPSYQNTSTLQPNLRPTGWQSSAFFISDTPLNHPSTSRRLPLDSPHRFSILPSVSSVLPPMPEVIDLTDETDNPVRSVTSASLSHRRNARSRSLNTPSIITSTQTRPHSRATNLNFGSRPNSLLRANEVIIDLDDDDDDYDDNNNNNNNEDGLEVEEDVQFISERPARTRLSSTMRREHLNSQRRMAGLLRFPEHEAYAGMPIHAIPPFENTSPGTMVSSTFRDRLMGNVNLFLQSILPFPNLNRSDLENFNFDSHLHSGIAPDRSETTSPALYNPPEPASEGFTRNIADNEMLVCPKCGDALCEGNTEQKRQIWIVKSCGHVYCGECTANRFAAKGSKNKSRKKKDVDTNDCPNSSNNTFPICVAPACTSRVTGPKSIAKKESA